MVDRTMSGARFNSGEYGINDSCRTVVCTIVFPKTVHRCVNGVQQTLHGLWIV